MSLVNVTFTYSVNKKDPTERGSYFVNHYLFYIVCIMIVLTICLLCCKKKKNDVEGENSVSLINNGELE